MLRTITLSDEVVGQCYESLYRNLGLNILGLAVAPDFKGKRIGKKLMEYIESYATNHQIHFIRLNSAFHRVEAHNFYEKIGYTCDKTQKRFIKKYDGGENS